MPAHNSDETVSTTSTTTPAATSLVLDEWVSATADTTLRSPVVAGQPSRTALGEDLDVNIGWDRFEKLMLAVCKSHLGLYGIRFRRYGTQGQVQHGIDLAGRQADGSYVVVQCKDYRAFTATNLKDAVSVFARGRRPFGASRLIVATSAATESTQLADELAALQGQYRDLDIDLWGAEQLNDLLRYHADIVARFWTRETADVFCTGAPLPGVPTPPADLQEQADRILLGPVNTDDILPILKLAQSKAVDAPAEAAQHFGEVAIRLEQAGFRGHAAIQRYKQLEAMEAAGQFERASSLAAELAVEALHRAERYEPRRLAGTLERLNSRTTDSEAGKASSALNLQLINAAVAAACRPVGQPDGLLAALKTDQARAFRHYPSLVLLLAEDLFATAPDQLAHISSLIDDAIAQATTREHEDEWDCLLRLRLVKAEYDASERMTLRRQARQRRVSARERSLINAREARRYCFEGRNEEALEAWRDAVNDAILARLTDDAADWLYAIRQLNFRYGPLPVDVNDEHRLAQALRSTGTGRFLKRAGEPRAQSMAALVRSEPIEAVLSSRRWLIDSIVSGSWTAETEALEFLADRYAENAEPSTASLLYQRAGAKKKLASLASAAKDEALPVGPLENEPWWVINARCAMISAQADLVPDSLAAQHLQVLIDLAIRVRDGEIPDSPLHDLKVESVKAMCELAARGTSEQAREVLELLSSDVPREPGHHRFTDDQHAAMCVQVAISHPSLATACLTRLFDLAEAGANRALELMASDEVVAFLATSAEASRQPGNIKPLEDQPRHTLLNRVLHLAEGDHHYAVDLLLFAASPDHPLAQMKAEDAKARILERTDPQPGLAGIGTRLVPDSYLVSRLPAPDRQACAERMLEIASNPADLATNRQQALQGLANVAAELSATSKSAIFAAARDFVDGNKDGGALEEFHGTPHPLSSLRVDLGSGSLKGHGVILAASSATSAEEQDWTRDQAVSLLRSDDSSEVFNAARALWGLPASTTTNVDAKLLITHKAAVVRQVAAMLAMRDPERYRETLAALAKDMDHHLRITLAKAVVRAVPRQSWLEELLARLSSDARHSVRAAAASETDAGG